MATLYIQKSSVDDITTPLGYVILTVAEEQVSETLIVMPKRPFGYWNKRFLKALNEGVISQTIYDTIINNQNETRQLIQILSDTLIDKQILVDLATTQRVPNINPEETKAVIMQQIINEGYQIVKKI